MPSVSLDRAGAVAAPTTTVGDPVPNNGMTLAQLVAEAQALMVGRTDILPARFKTYINLAYTDMVTSLKIDELKASIDLPLTSGSYLYRLPPVVFAIEEVSYIDSTDVANGGKPLEKSDMRAFRGRPVLSSTIREYFRYTDMLVTWPTTDAARTLSIDFKIRPTWLIDDSDCPLLNVEWHEGLLLLTKAKLLAASQEWEASMIAQNEYVNFVRRRLDPAAVEDDTKVVRSSVPRSNRMLESRRANPTPWQER